MPEFNKYSDGCICFEERELILISKYLNDTTELFKFAIKNNMNVNETWNLINGVCKIVKAAEMWKEEVENAMKEDYEIEHGNCSNG